MKLKDKTILVVGGAGFIGSHIVDLLLKEDVKEVIIYDNFCRGSRENLREALKDPRCNIFSVGGDILQADILDAAMSISDGVIDLAALWLLQCEEFPRSAFDVNIRGTFNVLESCVKHNIERLVYSSSASVYGNAVIEPMTEEHPYNNQTFYGATKIASEHIFKAFHKKYDLQGVCLRYMNVYGVRQDYKGVYNSVIMKVIDNILDGISPVVYGDGSQSYDFTYVTDPARASVMALKSSVPFGFYNISKGQKISITELVKLILKITNSDLPIIYKETGKTYVSNRIGDPTQAEKDLYFKCKVNIEEGLRRTVDWRVKQENATK